MSNGHNWIMEAYRLKSARAAKRLTQAEVARQLGIDQGYYSRLERGEKTPSLDVLQKLSQVLGVEAGWLMGSQAAEPPSAEGGRPSGRTAILVDSFSSPGLRDLALDEALGATLAITNEEWHALRSIDLPSPATKDGYVSLLFAIRAACRA